MTNEYKIVFSNGKEVIVKADSIEERVSHFILLKKNIGSDENQVVAICPRTTQFIIIKVR